MVQRRDIRSMADLAGEAATVATALVRDTHAGIAGHVFRAIGPAAKPVQLVHDAITGMVYGGVDAGARRATHLAGIGASRAWGNDGDAAVESRPMIGGALAVINGLYGDQLTNHRNELAQRMVIRHSGDDVALTAESVHSAFAEAGPRVAVFLHGLFLTERSWWRRPRIGDEFRSYGERLLADVDYTPIYFRYNTGLHVSKNGLALAGILRLLDELWPVPIEEIVFIGHSMGGLVARSACHYGNAQQHNWTRAVRHVICIASPHLGADIEKGVNMASWALAQLPETRGIAGFLNTRSVGIKDLRFGACTEDDWRDWDPDELLRDRCREVPFLPGVGYHFVATTAGPSSMGLPLGDYLVRSYSAAGRGKIRQIPFESENGLTLTGLHHFDLLNHPQVYAKLLEWIIGPALTSQTWSEAPLNA